MSAELPQVLTLDVRAPLGDFLLNVQTDVDLVGVTGLFGPSGSGKSTLLRVIAGFEPAARGRVAMGGRDWLNSSSGLDVPPHERGAGLVFQDARLFGHLDVAGNLAFAASRNNGRGPQLNDVVAALDLGPLLQRPVAVLSGGERQRVALGRTLLSNPQILLLDEPLAALDAARKRDILPYLESLQGRFALPTIYVSHQVDEIVRLADRVIVLGDGAIAESGPTSVVLNRMPRGPELEFELSAVLECRVVEHLHELQLLKIACGDQLMFVPGRRGLASGDRVLVRLRAGEVALATRKPRDISIRNVLRGSLRRVDENAAGPFAMAHIDVEGTTVYSQLTRQAAEELGLEPGMEVFALVKTASFDEHA